MEGLSCGDTSTTKRSNVTAVPIIWTNLKHTKIFNGDFKNTTFKTKDVRRGERNILPNQKYPTVCAHTQVI
jgi:hypothetical protein